MLLEVKNLQIKLKHNEKKIIKIIVDDNYDAINYKKQ